MKPPRVISGARRNVICARVTHTRPRPTVILYVPTNNPRRRLFKKNESFPADGIYRNVAVYGSLASWAERVFSASGYT